MTSHTPKSRPDMERAKIDPSAVFPSPETVAQHPALSREEKIEILRRWANDAAAVATAVEEGMPGGEPGGEETMLRRVTLALEAVAGPLDMERTAPSKQHGLPEAAASPKRR